MKTIKDIHTTFASACALVKKAMELGSVQQSRASANATALKTSTVMLADTSKMGENEMAALKAAVRLYNAGHAFQHAYGANLAHLAETHSLKVADDSQPENVAAMPAQAPSEPEAKGKKVKAA